MRLVERHELDTQTWEALVNDSQASVFSSVSYLDAVADNWCVLFNDDLSGGIACPYSRKLGVKILYAPFFHRQIEWVGKNRPPGGELLKQLAHVFPVADAQLRFGSIAGLPERHHQEVSPESMKRNQQVKRMLKKAARFEVIEEMRTEPLLDLLKTELSPRIAGINAHSLSLLRKLVTAFAPPKVLQLNLLENGSWKGAVWLLPFNGRLLYLKGTVTAAAKDQGGMYRLIDEAINLAFDRGEIFDFGGSNAEGVRRFNKNWGSHDVFYYHLRWNNAPLWWKILKSLRSAWKTK